MNGLLVFIEMKYFFFLLKMVQCKSQLNREIVVVGINLTSKGFFHFSFFKGHKCPQNP